MITLWPARTRAAALAGCKPTRDSLFFISFGVPIVIYVTFNEFNVVKITQLKRFKNEQELIFLWEAIHLSEVKSLRLLL